MNGRSSVVQNCETLQLQVPIPHHLKPIKADYIANQIGVYRKSSVPSWIACISLYNGEKRISVK